MINKILRENTNQVRKDGLRILFADQNISEHRNLLRIGIIGESLELIKGKKLRGSRK